MVRLTRITLERAALDRLTRPEEELTPVSSTGSHFTRRQAIVKAPRGTLPEMTQTSAAVEAEATLREIDASIDELASTGQFDVLASRLAADFRYNHSTGQSQSKDEWLAGLRPLVGRRHRIASSIDVEVHGDVAVAMGDLDIIWSDGRHNYDRYVRVYRRDDNAWRVVSQRTVPAADRARSAMSFEPEILALWHRTAEIDIETSRGDGAPTHRTVIWIVVDGEAAYVRSVRGKAGRWFRELSANPRGAVVADGKRVAVQAQAATDQPTIDRVSQLLRDKYAERSPGPTASMVRDEVLDTTLRLIPAAS